jgi:predicted porin
MKKTLVTLLASVAMIGAAAATDLPSKNKAPAVPASPVATESADTLTAAYGQDTAVGAPGTKVDDIYQLKYTHSLGGGFTVGGMAQTTQDTDNVLKQNLEGQVGYKLPTFMGLTFGGKVGVGESYVSTGNFPYFAAYGTADYKVMDGLTWNAVQYRYRSAFDTSAYGYQSHQLGTGVTYDLTKTYSISANYYRNFDTSSNLNATADTFMLGLNAKF